MSTLNGGPGNIVTNGLVLYLDAANYLSYTSGSTVWRDLSSSNLSGSLVNGPTFSSGNAGSIVVDGVDDVIRTNFITGSISSLTICVNGFKTSNNKLSALGGYINYDFFAADITGFQILNNNATFYITDASVNVSSGTCTTTQNGWAHWTMVFDGTQTGNSSKLKAYYNGVLQTLNYSGTVSTSLAMNINFQLGQNPLELGASDNSKYATCQIYNRALSATEVLQNYNATKGRFGL